MKTLIERCGENGKPLHDCLECMYWDDCQNKAQHYGGCLYLFILLALSFLGALTIIF